MAGEDHGEYYTPTDSYLQLDYINNPNGATLREEDLRKLKKSAKSADGKFMLFMPLVYFNSAKIAHQNFIVSLRKFNEAKDWFLMHINELNEFIDKHKGAGITQEVVEYIDQWPGGRCLDVEGAMEETHESLVETTAYFFNLLTNGVAAVESAVNLKMAGLLHKRSLSEKIVEEWNSKGIGDRPKHLLAWLSSTSSIQPPHESIFACFDQIVKSRNNFVHHKITPAKFTYTDISIENIAGDKNINKDFCSTAIDSIQEIIIKLNPADDICVEMTFNKDLISYAPRLSPSPYITRALNNET